MGVKKRFTISPKNNQKICDNKEKKYYLSIDADVLLKILNKLADENEQLKEIIVSQRDTIKRDNKWENKAIGEINELRKENEQLKKENNELILLVKKMGELGGFNKHLLKTINESFEERLKNNPMPTKSDNDE